MMEEDTVYPKESSSDKCYSNACRTQQYVVEMETLLTIQQAITSHLELRDVLQLIADEARKLTSAKFSFVYVLDEDDLILMALSGTTQHLDKIGYRFPVDNSMAGESILTGKPNFINNLEENDPRVFYQALKPFGMISCYLTVPLISADRAIGVIAVADNCAGNLEANSLRVLSMLAPSASIGIENAQLYQEQQIRRMEAESRHQMAKSMRVMLDIVNTNKSLEEILTYIVTHVSSRLLGCDSMAILGINPKDDTLFLQAANGLPESDPDFHNLPGIDSVRRVIKSNEPFAFSGFGASIENHLHENNRVARAQIAQGQLNARYQSWLIVPFTVSTQSKGAILMYYSEQKKFSDEEINLALMFADEVALTITNARLHIEAEKAAVNAERNHLARELHDAVSQTLFSAKLIAEVIPRLWDKDQNNARTQLDRLCQLIQGALAEMRTLLYELRPAVFKEAKLSELLKNLTEAVAVQSQLQISLTIEGDRLLSSEVQTVFYRITQEALNNISKHSYAQNVSISLFYKTDKVELTITDDGRGFDPTQIKPGHFGLVMMKERASMINASISISSKVGNGTTIELDWTYSN